LNFLVHNLEDTKKVSKKLFLLFTLLYFSCIFNEKIAIARQPTRMELETIHKETRFVFENFLQLWQEERYFELYKYGAKKSLEQISLEEFATRMVELDWVPLGLGTNREPKISFRYKTLVYVSAEIVFQHKNFFDLKFPKEQSFLLIKEKGKWSFDLLQMIRSPFYSPIN
tara:strand:+ start:213 stop:722 length:510 start_codon:yes stop_codon:yes gene_type:complete